MLAATAACLARAALVGGATVAFGALVAPVVRSASPYKRAILIIFCIVPLLAPPLLTAYCYARWSLPLVHYPWLKETLYVAILMLRIAPLGAVLFYLFPPTLSASGLHCARLARGSASAGLSRKLLLRQAVDSPGIVFSLAFLIAFHEFEIASLTSIGAWTVLLFDAHSGGIPWNESLKLAAFPFIVQVGSVAVLAILIKNRATSSAVATTAIATPAPGKMQLRAAWSLTTLAAVVVALLPATIATSQAATGTAQLLRSFALEREISASVIFGTGGGMLAFFVIAATTGRTRILLAMPGLFGSLLLALVAVHLFQFSPLRGIYDSPLPLLGTLTVLMLPLATLLNHLQCCSSHSAGAHVARLSKRWLPRWIASGRAIYLCIALLCSMAYMELTASAILAPPGMTTAPARLYNLMHYGQTAVLSAMTVTTFLVPLGGFALVWALLESVTRIFRHR